MLKFSQTRRGILSQKSDCLLLCVRPNAKRDAAALSAPVKVADGALDGLIRQACAGNRFIGQAGKTLLLQTPGFAHRRVLLVGIGELGKNRDERARRAREGLTAGAQALAKSGAKKAVAVLDDGVGLTLPLVASAMAAMAGAAYRFRLGGHFPPDADKKGLREVAIADNVRQRYFFSRACALADGMVLTRHLAEQPGNVCTPTFLAQTAKRLKTQHRGLSVEVLDAADIKKLKMGALMAVAQGSAQAAKLIVLKYRGGAKKTPPVALVGKGVTFDSGGISLKPAAAMDEMKFDMCGAATVLGVMSAVAEAALPINVVGVIPACENMPGGDAVKPGDVITAMSGKTIEVLNTDAEGRLILADALTYAERRFKPKTVIDIATLTGACVIALGHHTSGLMGRGEKLLADLHKVGNESGDTCWRLPLGEAYQKQLKSEYADLANIGGRTAGTITAACFLSQFVACDNWAHLDIAGTAWTTGKRASGRPVPLLFEYLAAQSQRR